MATGSGKTVTALICAARLQDHSDQPLLVVIAAPYRPLVEQWREEAGLFGVSPLGSGHLSSADRNSVISEAVRRLDRQVSSVEVAVVTHDYLLSDGFSEVLNSIPTSVRTLLIADEVHNLGRPRFLPARPSSSSTGSDYPQHPCFSTTRQELKRSRTSSATPSSSLGLPRPLVCASYQSELFPSILCRLLRTRWLNGMS